MNFWTPERISEDEFRLNASAAGCVGVPGRYAMMGGVTSAAVITAMEVVTGKQLLWSTTQFISHAPSEVDFDIKIVLLTEGGRTVQARGSLFVGERLVLETSAALSDASDESGEQYVQPLARVAPESCELKDPESVSGGLLDQFERRTAYQNDVDGREALWFRFKDRPRMSSAVVAVLGDFLPGAITQTRGSSSVDNTIRINRLEESEWVLAESHVQALQGRIYQGEMRLFAESGVLLGTASQTGIRPR